ncbi:uncharacterized protein LOC119666048 [Teleopsis dalmanni]|uniref:uncharacterized protein LOC119666048 n=1 Tax=Teleopsis dalmanni TaxID=139649 RepID=UPI0018CD9537|nr:uncharacterized protein LOC119666048 [Teleopsis dalmanni]
MCSPPARVNEHNLYNIPKKPVPFDTIHVDHFGPLPSIQPVRKHLFVVVDAFTKFVRLFAVKSTSTKEVIASLEKYFQNYSRPKRIISDRGTCFTSLEFSEFLLKHNINHVKVAVASAQANGQVERVNHVLKTMLSKMTDPINHADWVRMLPKVEFAINNSTHSSSKQTPSQLLFDVDQKGEVIDYLTEYLSEKKQRAHVRDLEQMRQEAAGYIDSSQKKNFKYFTEKSKPPKKYFEGDFVVIRHIDTTAGKNKKFSEKYRGPYVIHKVLPNDRYVLRDVDNCQITQMPYDGVVEAARIREWITGPDQNLRPDISLDNCGQSIYQDGRVVI